MLKKKKAHFNCSILDLVLLYQIGIAETNTLHLSVRHDAAWAVELRLTPAHDPTAGRVVMSKETRSMRAKSAACSSTSSTGQGAVTRRKGIGPRVLLTT